jgi:hypothetical protein
MTTRAYALARRWTTSILAAGTLGAAALGVHLAQAQTTATTAQGVTQQTPGSQRALSQREQRQRASDDGWGEGGDDSGLSSQSQALPGGGQGSFQQVVPPGNSGIGRQQVRSTGS